MRPACPEALFTSHWWQGLKFLRESGFETEPYVNYQAVLPLPELVLKIKTMVSQCTTVRPAHMLFSGNKTFNELIVLFRLHCALKTMLYDDNRRGPVSCLLRGRPTRHGPMPYGWPSAQHNVMPFPTFGNQ